MMKNDEKIKKTGNLTLFGQINDYPCFAPGALAESPIKHDTHSATKYSKLHFDCSVFYSFVSSPRLQNIQREHTIAPLSRTYTFKQVYLCIFYLFIKAIECPLFFCIRFSLADIR